MAIPTTPSLLQLDNLYQILVELGENVRQGYVNRLKANGHPTEKHNLLATTVRSEVIVKGTTYEVVLNLEDYWKYVEEGTRPHWPPPSAILEWVTVKPVIPRPDERGRIPTPKQLAFLISRKIAEVGTKGTHDLKMTEDTILAQYEELVKEALERDVLDYIEKITQ